MFASQIGNSPHSHRWRSRWSHTRRGSTESPPVALALPLSFSVYALARDRLELSEVTVGVILIGLAFALTKGFGAIELGVAACFAAAALRGRVETRRALLYAVPIAVAATVSFAFFALTSGWLTELLDLKFLPETAIDGVRAQRDHRDTQAAAPALLVLGEVLLAAAFLRARAWVPLTFLAAAIAGTWFVGGHGFDITVGISIVVALLVLSEQPTLLRAELPLVVAAGLALALSSMFRDIWVSAPGSCSASCSALVSLRRFRGHAAPMPSSASRPCSRRLPSVGVG